MRLHIAFALIALAISSNAQTKCNSISIGMLFTQLQKLKTYDLSKLRYQEYDHFDFETFSPVGSVGGSSFVSVGKDRNGEIKNIIFIDPGEKYSIIAYDFDGYRIFLVKREDNSGEFLFTPSVIFYSKGGGGNYMINVKAQFDNASTYDLFDHFPLGDFKEISCLMKLDKFLYPHEMFKFSNLKIVLYSGLKYVSGDNRRLELEVLHLFIDSAKGSQNLSIGKDTCLDEIVSRSNEFKATSNLIVFTKPSIFNELQAPLWIFSGTHEYH